MTDEAVSRRRENAAFFLRILAFGLIFTLISCAVLYVLTPKYDYGPGSMMNLPFSRATPLTCWRSAQARRMLQ